MRSILMTSALLALLLAAPGCRHVKTPVVAFSDDGELLPYKSGTGLVARSDSPIPDVPMPVGFKAVASRSSSTFDGRIRTVHHTYQGRSRLIDAVSFYQTQLPVHRWQFVQRTDATDGSSTLNFVKGPERVQIDLHQGTLLTDRIDSSVTTIVITMGARDGA